MRRRSTSAATALAVLFGSVAQHCRTARIGSTTYGAWKYLHVSN
ncbi:hypothetical protein ABZ471_04895 [Streptomyces sp. NPDC005728]